MIKNHPQICLYRPDSTKYGNIGRLMEVPVAECI